MERDYITARSLAKRYGRSPRTLGRWTGKNTNGFPQPIRISGRRMWAVKEIEAWERSLASVARQPRKEAE